MRNIAKSTALGLTPRARQVLALLAVGLDRADKNHPDIPIGKPLGPKQVRQVLGCPYSYVTGLMLDPVFKLEMAKAISAVRAGYAPAVIARLGDIALESPDEGKAIAAGRVILGEDAKAPMVNVSVATQTNVAQDIRPGYIVRLPPDLERKRPETELQKP